MATIKSYTDIEQSRKLVEILPLESADMHYGSYSSSFIDYPIPNSEDDYKCGYTGLPCWSLASLLNYLKSKNKFPEIKELSDGRFKLTTYIWDGKDCIQVLIGDSIVDACVAMIEKLNELKML